MNPQGTSFIPQRPNGGQIQRKTVHKVYVFTYLAYIFFFGTILSTAAVLGYSYLIEKQLQDYKDKIVTEEARFSVDDIDSIKAFETKIDTVTERMDQHLSILPILGALERIVSQKLMLDNFKYTRENDSAPGIVIAGKAVVLNSIAFQRQMFTQENIFAQAAFDQVTLSAVLEDEQLQAGGEGIEKIIPFNLKAIVESSLLQYRPTLVIPDETLTDEFDVTTEQDNLDTENSQTSN